MAFAGIRYAKIMLILARFLHIAIAAAWFGHKLLIPSDLGQIVDADRDEAVRSLGRIKRAENLGKITGAGTLLTGGWLIFLVGPTVVTHGIYAGLGLVLVAIGLGAVIARPASTRFRIGIESGDSVLARVSARTLSRVLVAESVLWSAALVSMLI